MRLPGVRPCHNPSKKKKYPQNTTGIATSTTTFATVSPAWTPASSSTMSRKIATWITMSIAMAMPREPTPATSRSRATASGVTTRS